MYEKTAEKTRKISISRSDCSICVAFHFKMTYSADSGLEWTAFEPVSDEKNFGLNAAGLSACFKYLIFHRCQSQIVVKEFACQNPNQEAVGYI